MKTEVLIPDELFHEAEKRAIDNKISRSQLYAEALVSFLKPQRDAEWIEEMNRVLDGIDQTPDPAWAAVQIAALKRSEWK